MAADTRQVTVLSLLDLLAAFDFVDHDLLLQRCFGLVWVVLELICLFLTDHTQQIAYGGHCRQSEYCCLASHKGLCLVAAVYFVHCGT